MSILSLIKKRSSTRRFFNKPVPKNIINKILEAGIWGPAIHRFQPWKFVVIREIYLIKKISNLIIEKIREADIPGFIIYPTASPLLNARVLIFVYNTNEFVLAMKKMKKKCFNRVEITEVSAISAAIQNMILTAEDLGLGSCWLDAPLFCQKEINRLLNTNHKLVATLAFGYSIDKGKRHPRKPIAESIKFVNKLRKI